MVFPYVRADIGGTVYDNRTHIIQAVQAESGYGSSATIILENSEGQYVSTDFRGVKVQLGWGAMAEYSNVADLYVDKQYDISIRGKLYTVLECIDNWVRLDRRKVMGDTIAAAYETETAGGGGSPQDVAQIITAQLISGMSLTVDSSDGQQDTVEPDLIYEVTASNKQVILDVIKYTENLLRMRAGDLHMIHNNQDQQHRLTGTLTGLLTAAETVTGSNSSATGKVVYQSVASGAGYLVIEAETGTWETAENAVGGSYACNTITTIDEHDYVYELIGDHTFYENTRSLASLPVNRIIVVDSYPDTSGTTHTWIGQANDEADQTDQGIITQTWEYPNVASNAEAAAIAESILAFYNSQTLQGELVAPMNCGQEIYDYVKIIDQRAGWTGGSALTRLVGSITRLYAPGVYKIILGFGGADWGMTDMVGKLQEVIKDIATKEIAGGRPKITEEFKKALAAQQDVSGLYALVKGRAGPELEAWAEPYGSWERWDLIVNAGMATSQITPGGQAGLMPIKSFWDTVIGRLYTGASEGGKESGFGQDDWIDTDGKDIEGDW